MRRERERDEVERGMITRTTSVLSLSLCLVPSTSQGGVPVMGMRDCVCVHVCEISDRRRHSILDSLFSSRAGEADAGMIAA